MPMASSSCAVGTCGQSRARRAHRCACSLKYGASTQIHVSDSAEFDIIVSALISALGRTAWFECGLTNLLFAGVIPRADCIPCCAPSSASKVSRRQGRSTSSEGTDGVNPKVLGRTCDQQCVSYSDVGAMRAACAACLRTATAYWPRLRSGSVLGTTTVRWNASQFSAESSSMVFTVKFCRNLSM
jgi:hypothetical protein